MGHQTDSDGIGREAGTVTQKCEERSSIGSGLSSFLEALSLCTSTSSHSTSGAVVVLVTTLLMGIGPSSGQHR